jgi:hypothetical protein
MFSFFNWCLGSFTELTEYIEYLTYKEQKQNLYSLSKSDISSDANTIESEIDIDLGGYVSIQNKNGTITLATSVF